MKKTEDFITRELAKYDLPAATITKLQKKYMDVKVSNPEDIDNYMFARSGYKEVSKLRIDIEKKRVELKADALAFGKAVDGEAKRLKLPLEAIEAHLMVQRKIVEDEQARIKKAKEDAILAEEARIKQEEEARLEAQRAEQEAKERELKERQEKIEAQEKAVADEKKRIQDEETRKQEETARALEIETERKEAADLAVKQEAEKRRLADEQRIKDEQLAKLKKEHDELMKPDREKLNILADALIGFPYPALTSKEAQAVTTAVQRQLNALAKQIKGAKL